MPFARAAFLAAQAAVAAVALARLARGRDRRAPLSSDDAPAPASPVTVVVPARDEEARLGPCLAGATRDPDVAEVVVVVDHGTSDATARVAAAHGARVVSGAAPPAGWVGKPWALEQGLEAARGEIVVALDADTRPRPGLVRALARELVGGADLVSAAARFDCDGPGERLLHPSLLATLVYRFGPVGVEAPAAHRTVVNGQCLAFRRDALRASGGFGVAAAHMNDDIALARALAAAGWRIAFLDGADLVSVDMHDSARGAWREWGRSIAMQDTTPPAWLALDLLVVWLVMAAPLPRLLARRGTPLDVALVAVRVALLAALARAYERRGLAFWLSPLADVASAARLTLSVLRPPRTWRGRTYAPPPRRGSAGRSAS